jgi:PleD family two-component response regulator
MAFLLPGVSRAGPAKNGAADKALSEAKTTGRNKVCVRPGFAGPG